MSEITARFALPLLQAGQAQKEIDHNEALTRIDAALHPLVRDAGIETPPASPAEGEAWLLGAAPTGDWAGRALTLAVFTGGGWRFVAPGVGMSVWSIAAGRYLRWDGGGWRDGELVGARLSIAGLQVVGARAAAVPDASGGTTIDTQARATLAALLAALRGHGLIAV